MKEPICTFNIKPSILKAMAIFASSDEHRFILCGVRVEITDKVTILVATDGRRMAAFNASEDVTSATDDAKCCFVIPAKLIAKCPSERLITVLYDGSEVGLKGAYIVTADAIDGNYPNWRAVMPSEPSGSFTQITIHPQFIADVSKAAGILLNDPAMVITGESETSAMVCRSFGNDRFIGVLMPLRASTIKPIPEWAVIQKPASNGDSIVA